MLKVLGDIVQKECPCILKLGRLIFQSKKIVKDARENGTLK
jgi:hypothetical protein